jgi:membrane protein
VRVRRLPQRIFAFYWGQGIADDVPALTYYLVLSLAPFALGVAAIEALLLSDVLAATEVADQVNRFLPVAVHGDIERLVVGTRDNSPLLIAIAVIAMLWTTSGAIGVIERVESRILEARRHNVVVGRARNVVLGALVALAVVAASAGAPVIGDVSSDLDLRSEVPNGLLLAVNALGSVVVFALVYRYAPRTPLRWRSAFVGALPAGIALQLVPVVVGLYFGSAAGFAAVRVFLLLAVLLLGLYVMAMVMLVGAGLATQHERGVRAAELPPRAGAPAGMLRDDDRDDEDDDAAGPPRRVRTPAGATRAPARPPAGAPLRG